MPPEPPFDRSLALACHVRTFSTRWLELRCCDGVTLLPLRQLGTDERRTLADVVLRLRCRACGGGPASVALVESPLKPPDGYGAPKRWRLSLVEPAE